jgi:choline dehydrogenase-like flavoprotein
MELAVTAMFDHVIVGAGTAGCVVAERFLPEGLTAGSVKG